MSLSTTKFSSSPYRTTVCEAGLIWKPDLEPHHDSEESINQSCDGRFPRMRFAPKRFYLTRIHSRVPTASTRDAWCMHNASCCVLDTVQEVNNTPSCLFLSFPLRRVHHCALTSPSYAVSRDKPSTLYLCFSSLRLGAHQCAHAEMQVQKPSIPFKASLILN